MEKDEGITKHLNAFAINLVRGGKRRPDRVPHVSDPVLEFV